MILVDDWLFTIFGGSLPFVRANQHSFSLGGGGIYDCWNQSEISIIWGLGVLMLARANQHSLYCACIEWEEEGEVGGGRGE